MYEDFDRTKPVSTTRQMNKHQHYQLTRIFIPILVTLFFAGNSGIILGDVLQTGSIQGKVVADIPDQRKPLSGVTVTLSSERLGDKQIQTITDLEGQFDFPGLVAGDYVVTVEFSGFKKYEKKLSVQIEATVEHDILLQPVPITENVTIKDDQIDGSKTESTTPSVITQEAIRNAPRRVPVCADECAESRGARRTPARYQAREFRFVFAS